MRIQLTATFARTWFATIAVLLWQNVDGFSTQPLQEGISKAVQQQQPQHWMDFLKFDSQPKFNVLEMTKEYCKLLSFKDAERYYADDYVFRGSIIGPITAKDVRETQEGFNIMDSYPDLDIQRFGFTVDPENPYRCYFFERWKGTNTGDLNLGPVTLPATQQVADIPTHIVSVHWNPDAKIVYQCLSSPLDRFEGNTKGQGAVFGLLTTGGVNTPDPSPGNWLLQFNQKVIAPLLGAGKAYSSEEDIPQWWKSTSRGADSNDM